MAEIQLSLGSSRKKWQYSDVFSMLKEFCLFQMVVFNGKVSIPQNSNKKKTKKVVNAVIAEKV